MAAAVLAIAAIGCGKQDNATTSASGGGAGVASNADSTTPKVASDKADASSIDAAKPATAEPKLPDALLNDAYSYYSLSSKASHDEKLDIDDGLGHKVSLTGSEIVQFDRMDDGKALYKVVRTGGIHDDLGDEGLRLTDGGIVQFDSSKGKVTRESQEMIAKLSKGAKWTSDGAMKLDTGQEESQKIRYKVVGDSAVTTPAGTFKALLITSKGSLSGSQSGTIDGKEWYVKDRGLVKSVIEMHIGKRLAIVTLQQTS